jgi:hypothetical protein
MVGGLALALLLAGCGHAVRVTTLPPGCNVSNSIALQYGAGRIVLDSECIAVSPGSSVTLTLSPVPTEPGIVRTKFRGIGNRWLDQSNGASLGTITLPVPRDNGNSNKEFKYEIHVDGVGLLDPRIVIQ